MSFVPENTYDPESKIWSGPLSQKNYFSPDLSVGEIIFNEMRRHPQLIAQVSDTENTILTCNELCLNSMRVASYMRQLGLKQSDIVGIIGRNTTHIFAVVYACFFNGIAFHSLNIKYEEKTIENLYKITKPSLIFCDGDEYEKVQTATKDLNVKIITMRNHTSESVTIEEVLTTPIVEGFKPVRLEQGTNQNLAILCSSGTTGDPKAVTISNSHSLFKFSDQLTSADVVYTHSTLDWLAGLGMTIFCGIFNPTRIIADNDYDPIRVMRIVEKYKVTWLHQAPSHMSLLVNSEEFPKAEFSSVQHYLYGGSRCSLQSQQLLRSRLSKDCMHFTYGFTELGSVATANSHFDKKPDSSGRLLGGFKMKILNEQGESLGPSEVGEVCMSNGQYWAGYYGNPQETRNMCDSDGWFHSGDLGYMDEDGFLYIVDRKKDMLKCHHIMYYPHELETVIAQMPDVAEVCVFGVWSDVNGDEPAAAVIKRIGSTLKSQDVVDYVRKHVKASYKQLLGGVLIVDDLKRSPNGKTNRRANKEYFLKVRKAN
ncbi:uncharacterized protein Dwil_GK15543 [Drosophila willistoni]|uniref:AMP-dependent synthetase/ligase domain-containing protein n=1 Tax=Drosophila willistoni TaxID=7260 RepID=B4MWV5_DROWI|nr:luciferin 4-monooxygenase [Drosophila willistoni]EDW76594.2 uncharacterized protein Dwil_GK15543 [Drosophila willistoni]